MFRWKRIDRIHSDWKFELSWFTGMNPVNPKFFGIIRIDADRPDSFGFTGFIRINSDISNSMFGLKRIDRIHSDWKFELSWFTGMNPVNPNQYDQSEFFEIILIDADRPYSFGLIGFTGFIRIVQIHSDWMFRLNGLIRIDFDWASGLIRIEN